VEGVPVVHGRAQERRQAASLVMLLEEARDDVSESKPPHLLVGGVEEPRVEREDRQVGNLAGGLQERPYRDVVLDARRRHPGVVVGPGARVEGRARELADPARPERHDAGARDRGDAGLLEPPLVDVVREHQGQARTELAGGCPHAAWGAASIPGGSTVDKEQGAEKEAQGDAVGSQVARTGSRKPASRSSSAAARRRSRQQGPPVAARADSPAATRGCWDTPGRSRSRRGRAPGGYRCPWCTPYPHRERPRARRTRPPPDRNRPPGRTPSPA